MPLELQLLSSSTWLSALLALAALIAVVMIARFLSAAQKRDGGDWLVRREMIDE